MLASIRNITVWQVVKRFIWASLFAAILWLVNTIWYKPFNINHFYDRLILETALQDPESLTKLGILERYGIKFYNDKLSFLPTQESQAQEISKALEMLNAYKKSSQNADQRLSTAILSRYLEDLLLETSFADHHYYLSSFEGIHLDFPNFMVSYHHIHTVKDAEDYLIRLSQFDKKMDRCLEVLQKQKTSGALPPRFMIENILVQIDTFLVSETKENLLFQDFSGKIEAVEVMSEPVKREMNFQANTLLQDVVYPSYEKLANFLTNSLDSLREGDGIWRMNNGEGYYLALLRKYGSTEELIGEELYQKALTEANISLKKLQKCLDSSNISQKKAYSLRDFYFDPKYKFKNDSMGRAECLAKVDSLVRVNKSLFHKTVWKDSIVNIQTWAFSNFQATDLEAIEYREATLHSKIVPIWKLNFVQMGKWHKAMMPTMVAGELARHYQRTAQKNTSNTPIFRQIIDFEAFREGWQAYIINILEEKGYFSNHEMRMGKLYWEYIKQMLLVIDVGIHHKQWTRENAIKMLENEIGMSKEQAVSEVDRVVAYPAQVWTYYYGKQGFNNLRKKQEEMLGNKFELLNFHERILKKGSMPLDILAKDLEKNVRIK